MQAQDSDGVRAAVRPADALESPEHRSHAAHGLYVRSHQAYDAGEARSRGYQWPEGVNPATHTFGARASPAAERACTPTLACGGAVSPPVQRVRGRRHLPSASWPGVLAATHAGLLRCAGKDYPGRAANKESPELAQSLRHLQLEQPATGASVRQHAVELRSQDRLGQPRQLPCADRCVAATRSMCSCWWPCTTHWPMPSLPAVRAHPWG